MPTSRSRLIPALQSRLFALSLITFAFTAFPTAAANASGRLLLAAQDFNFVLEGKITRQSPGKLTVNIQGNIVFQVSYDDRTEIKKKDGGAATADDLRVGVKVYVEGDLTESGEVLALRIQVEEEPGEAKR